MEVINKQQTEQITIVEYDPSYAAAVAEMWNKSQDGWGGGNSIMTEDQVLKQEANSTNLHLYLALDGDKVVGYCSLGEYREDEGALYIPLLNVRSDYHGKKIGKKLVLKALEKAIEMKWPRLDLYTWPGNTKAVPLYKKCGFFWEDRDDTTHLMNFIPSVMQTEAVLPFFEDGLWYENSTRKIETIPDGKKENEFHFYEYSWNHAAHGSLKMEFERFGRGLRSIETDDYKISATVEDFDLVFGSDYTIQYHITNKSGKPLAVEMEGMNDKNIHFEVSKKISVDQEETIEIPFTLNPISEEQSVWRTHPAVTSLLKINGKKAVFKVGIRPKYPVKLDCTLPENLSFIGRSSAFYLNFENNFNEDVTFSFELPHSDFVQIDNRGVSVTLAAKAKQSIPVSFTLLKHGFYSADLQITATKKDGTEVQFTKKIGTALKGMGAKLAGECDTYYHVCNGQYQLKLNKFNNWISPGKGDVDFKIAFMVPKLGKPFSEEISLLRPEVIEPLMNEGYAGFRAKFQSQAFPGLQLATIVKLYSEGLMEQHYEITNTSEAESTDEVWLNSPIMCRLLDRAVLPYEGKYIELNDSMGSFLSYWNNCKLTENWIFLQGQNNPRGISWPIEEKVHFSNWFMYFEHNFGKLAAQQTVETKPVTISFGAFHDWQSFREYATEKSDKKAVSTTNHMTLSVNDGNPFVKDNEIKAVAKDYKSSFFNGFIEMKLDDEILQSHLFASDEELTGAEFDIQVPNDKAVHVLTSKMNLDSIDITRQSAAFVMRDTPVTCEKTTQNDLEVLSVDNGEITISASAQFAPTLFSLQYNNHDWMDSSFPKPAPKSWWNPWFGGIAGLVEGTSLNSLLKEMTAVDFVEKVDNKGNVWKGLKVSTHYKKHETFKGLEIHKYFLLLPGVPVLASTTEIVQNTGSYLHGKNFYTGCFLSPGPELTKSWGSFQGENGEWAMVYGGKGEQEMTVDRSVVFGSDNHENLLQIVVNQNATYLDSYINLEVIEIGYAEKLNLQHGATHVTSPVFYVFNNKVIPDTALEDLKKLSFS
ncbi:GNAT family N-acetyltransferase [Fictibacillus nanhaiensis]|uniref:GNAT family N-acetyltransferase n=1 Tax=Fictibacillus nanhaiensis TaxID=742169 RepID=UPI001C98A31D|nr:GNAT family N-acetyltransferase [Fictibacillus nanhaiensis]MBY6037641.1 GNAT family N-acetyltransferase [Fictibacillus nanhaiensis]